MGSVLEEALLKNMQLQDGMALLGKEIEDLRRDNERYRMQLERLRNGDIDSSYSSLPSSSLVWAK